MSTRPSPSPITIDRGYGSPIRSYLSNDVEDYSTPGDSYDGPGDYYYNGYYDPVHDAPSHHHGSPYYHWNHHRSYYTTIATKSGTDWYLYRAGTYDITGSNTGKIVTNGKTVSTLNFTSAGTLYVSTGDTVNIKAVSGAVELQDDTNIVGLPPATGLVGVRLTS